MTGAIGFVLLAVLVPVLVGEARDLAPALAEWLLRSGARHVGRPGLAERYEEEWLADLERVPGKATKLVHACGVVALSVPRLRSQYRRAPGGELLPGRIAGTATERSAAVPGVDASLQRVAEILVPRFADHLFIDLFQGDALIRRVQRHADGWTPPPGTWAQAGEQIRFPEGHFCERAMTHLDTVLVADVAKGKDPAPSARSLATAQQVGLKSVIAAPLYARGALLGVMAVATSGLTGRDESFAPGDRDLVRAMASRVSAAIDAAAAARSCRSPVLPSVPPGTHGRPGMAVTVAGPGC